MLPHGPLPALELLAFALVVTSGALLTRARPGERTPDCHSRTGSPGASFAPLGLHAPPMEWQVLFRAAEPRTDTQQGMAEMEAALVRSASLSAISIAAGPLMVRASPSVLTSSRWLGCAKATSSRQKIGRPGTPRSAGSPLILNWPDLIDARPVRWT
jgi:hypothetical protein